MKPLRTALFDRKTGKHDGEQLLVLDKAQAEFRFSGFAEPPVISLNRGFSAPIAVEAPKARRAYSSRARAAAALNWISSNA